ncbi:hypothetical protein [Alteraurantiacibacter buctensis]|uniref:Uncharacterized protein n=1 Tax=Alteraurantiacibacter buctensis TaxID=1503981 RepID=A0A844YYB8_9SPHN|nr:hypothetical protein [Alteraurantiacibacter buctensis]MXO72018.1 hypothetical protein [Alteraurantiacibacter buctensis]
MSAILIILASAFSCTTYPPSSGLRRYADLEGQLGQNVTLVGYWSSQHEATGIYFGNRWYRDAPEQCVSVEPILPAQHRDAVRVAGFLEKSGCGDELICLTVCQPYVLKNAHMIQ